MRPDEGQIEILDPKSVEVWRAKSGPERLHVANQMWKIARVRLNEYLRFKHPEWDEAQVQREVVRRFSHGSAELPLLQRLEKRTDRK